MFNVTLSNIRWESNNQSLPKELVWEIKDEEAANWNDRFQFDLRANKPNMIQLLKDTFQVDAERKYGVPIQRCWLKTNLKFGGE